MNAALPVGGEAPQRVSEGDEARGFEAELEATSSASAPGRAASTATERASASDTGGSSSEDAERARALAGMLMPAMLTLVVPEGAPASTGASAHVAAITDTLSALRMGVGVGVAPDAAGTDAASALAEPDQAEAPAPASLGTPFEAYAEGAQAMAAPLDAETALDAATTPLAVAGPSLGASPTLDGAPALEARLRRQAAATRAPDAMTTAPAVTPTGQAPRAATALGTPSSPEAPRSADRAPDGPRTDDAARSAPASLTAGPSDARPSQDRGRDGRRDESSHDRALEASIPDGAADRGYVVASSPNARTPVATAAASPAAPAAAPALPVTTPDGHIGQTRAAITVGEGDDRVRVVVHASGAQVRVDLTAASGDLASAAINDRPELDRALATHGLKLGDLSAQSSGHDGRSAHDRGTFDDRSAPDRSAAGQHGSSERRGGSEQRQSPSHEGEARERNTPDIPRTGQPRADRRIVI